MSAVQRIAVPVAAESVPTPATNALELIQEYLILRLSAKECDIDVPKPQEIHPCETSTRPANARAFNKEVVNLPGVIVLIVGSRIKRTLAEANYDTSSVVIVLNVAKRVIGVVVDFVSDAIGLNADRIKPAPEISDAADVRFITGLRTAKQGAQERIPVLVNIERMLANANMGLVERQPQ